MPELLTAIILAIIQGITEWLPISSSGHLVIAQKLLNYQNSLVFDVALHFGTLMSVFVYFGKDITNIFQDIVKFKFHSENSKLGFYILLSAIPAAIAGYLLRNIMDTIFNTLPIVAVSFGITGLLLIITSLNLNKLNKKLNAKKSLIIGTAQIISLLPGVSRSGTTTSAGILLGLNEKTALKFSFLMSIPVIFGANILEIGNQKLPIEFLWATLTAFIVGLITIHLLYRYILTSRKNLRYFGIYALVLSLILLISLFI